MFSAATGRCDASSKAEARKSLNMFGVKRTISLTKSVARFRFGWTRFAASASKCSVPRWGNAMRCILRGSVPEVPQHVWHQARDIAPRLLRVARFRFGWTRCWWVISTRCQNITVYFPLNDCRRENCPKMRVKRSTCALSLWSEQHTIQVQ